MLAREDAAMLARASRAYVASQLRTAMVRWAANVRHQQLWRKAMQKVYPSVTSQQYDVLVAMPQLAVRIPFQELSSNMLLACVQLSCSRKQKQFLESRCVCRLR